MNTDNFRGHEWLHEQVCGVINEETPRFPTNICAAFLISIMVCIVFFRDKTIKKCLLCVSLTTICVFQMLHFLGLLISSLVHYTHTWQLLNTMRYMKFRWNSIERSLSPPPKKCTLSIHPSTTHSQDISSVWCFLPKISIVIASCPKRSPKALDTSYWEFCVCVFGSRMRLNCDLAETPIDEETIALLISSVPYLNNHTSKKNNNNHRGPHAVHSIDGFVKH